MVSTSFIQNSSVSEEETPMNTPVRDPLTVEGLMPASTIASNVASNSMRSCGSIACACLGCTPKKEASKLPRSLILAVLSGSPWRPADQRRSSSVTMSISFIRFSLNSSILDDSGKRPGKTFVRSMRYAPITIRLVVPQPLATDNYLICP